MLTTIKDVILVGCLLEPDINMKKQLKTKSKDRKQSSKEILLHHNHKAMVQKNAELITT